MTFFLMFCSFGNQQLKEIPSKNNNIFSSTCNKKNINNSMLKLVETIKYM